MIRTQARQAIRNERSGAALLLFVVLVFALLGIASLTIDLGTALLTQVQMQNAVDSAALEGVRMRDHDFLPAYSNYARRERVAQFVRYGFDDDLHPTQGSSGGPDSFPPDADPDAMRFGAGPSVRLVGGQGPDNVGATIDTSTDPYVDDPLLQANYIDNAANGDMLSGTYVPDASHVENSNYQRADFTPGSHATGSDFESLGFLVRMRRTSLANPLDHQAGVSSCAPGVPFLVGLGTAIHAAPGSSYNPRTMGMSVRATAIAAGSPALAVSYSPCQGNTLIPDPALQASVSANLPLMGFYGVALRADFWKAITQRSLDDWVSFRYQLEIAAATGELKLVDVPASQTWALPFQNQIVGELVYRGRSLGDTVVPISLAQYQNGVDAQDQADAHCRWMALEQNAQNTFQERGYLALHEPITDADGHTVERVIGYGFGKITFSPGSSTNRLVVSAGLEGDYFNEVECWSGQSCASAHLSLDAEPLDTTAWQHVFERLDALVYDIPTGQDQRYDFAHIRRGTLLASTLVR